MRRAFAPALSCLLALPLSAFSPGFHEAQTRRAMGLVPRGMAAFLGRHGGAVLTAARGKGNDQVPTVEDVEEQFHRVLKAAEERRRPERIAHELGVLAHQVQLLMDPSALRGSSPLRDTFEAYGDEKLPRLVLSREPFWAASAPVDPRPPLTAWARTKFERHQSLGACFDEANGRRRGPWDELSVPFAQLQLTYSNAIHATANLWILVWRVAGEELEGTASGG